MRWIHGLGRVGVLGFAGLSLVVLLLLLRGGVDLTDRAEAGTNGGPGLFQDSDNDGLGDSLELYLNAASTALALTASPYNPDSDGDGQPDGFEYCLSGGKEVFSPGQQWAVVPKLTMASHRSGEDIVLSLLVIPGELNAIEKFQFLVATPGQNGPVLHDLTAFLATTIESVGFAHHGPYLMAVYQLRLPIWIVRNYGAIAVGAVGVVAGTKVGDSATLAMHGGKCFRWVYKPFVAAGGNSGSSGEAQPQDPNYPAGWLADEVCGSIEVREPTATPGLLRSVVQSIGCTAGTWACPAGVCSMSGSAAIDKPVIDVFSLILPNG